MAITSALIAFVVAVAAITPLPLTPMYNTHKVAAYYAPGVMEQVADNRGMSLEGYLDGVAVISDDVSWLGREVYISFRGGPIEGPYLVVDVAWSHDLPALIENNEGIEVGYVTAERWGIAGQGRVGPVLVYVVGGGDDGAKEQ